MKNHSVIWALFAGVAIGVGLVSFTGCKKGAGAGDTVASVNGTPISQDEYLHYMMLKPKVLVASNRGTVEANVSPPLGFQVLNDLVKQKIVVQMAKEAGVYPTDDQINKEIDFQVAGDPNFVKNLTAQGLSLEMIKNALAVEMAQRNLLTRGVTVSDDDLAKYEKEHPEQFTVPKSYNIYWILVKKPEDKKAVDAELNRGQRFPQVAMQYSQSQNAKEMQGLFPYHQLKDIPYKEISDPISKLKEQQATDWITASDGTGYAKFFVDKITPAHPLDMNDHLKEVLRRMLAQQRGSQAVDLNKQIMEREKDSNVQVQEDGLKRLWDAYVKSLQAQSPTPSLEQSVQGATGGATGAASTAGGVTSTGTPTPGPAPATGGTTGK